MELGQCIGLTETNKLSSSGFLTLHRQKRNNYIDKNFFEDKNYQLIIDCLDGGKPFFFTCSRIIVIFRL